MMEDIMWKIHNRGKLTCNNYIVKLVFVIVLMDEEHLL